VKPVGADRPGESFLWTPWIPGIKIPEEPQGHRQCSPSQYLHDVASAAVCPGSRSGQLNDSPTARKVQPGQICIQDFGGTSANGFRKSRSACGVTASWPCRVLPRQKLSRTRYGILAPASFQYTKTAVQRIAALQASWQTVYDPTPPAAPRWLRGIRDVAGDLRQDAGASVVLHSFRRSLTVGPHHAERARCQRIAQPPSTSLLTSAVGHNKTSPGRWNIGLASESI
jgi:hypothetical protein